MPIVNFRIKRISGERNDMEVNESTNVNVSSNFLIVSMEKKKSKDIGDYLQVNFKFNVKYEPGMGTVDMDGVLWYRNKDLDKVAKEKKGKIYVQAEAMKEISTTILRDSLLEAMDITRKVRLPIPVSLPKVNVKKEEVAFPDAKNIKAS